LISVSLILITLYPLFSLTPVLFEATISYLFTGRTNIKIKIFVNFLRNRKVKDMANEYLGLTNQTSGKGIANAKSKFVEQSSPIISATFNANTNYIQNVVDPALPQDAATRNYVDGAVSSLLSEFCIAIRLAGTLAGSTFERSIFAVPTGGLKIKKVDIVPDGIITSDVTNYFTIQVLNKGIGGAGVTVLAQKAFSSGGPFNPYIIIDIGGSLSTTLAVNEVLTIKKIEAAAGMTTPDLVAIIRFSK